MDVGCYMPLKSDVVVSYWIFDDKRKLEMMILEKYCTWLKTGGIKESCPCMLSIWLGLLLGQFNGYVRRRESPDNSIDRQHCRTRGLEMKLHEAMNMAKNWRETTIILGPYGHWVKNTPPQATVESCRLPSKFDSFCVKCTERYSGAI